MPQEKNGQMRQGLVTTTDATPAVIPLGQMGPSRGMAASLSVNAYDRTNNNRQATGILDGIMLRRFGNAQPTGLPALPFTAPVTFDPNAGPWNTITAVLNSDAQNNLFLTVTGLAATIIDWDVTLMFQTGKAN